MEDKNQQKITIKSDKANIQEVRKGNQEGEQNVSIEALELNLGSISMGMDSGEKDSDTILFVSSQPSLKNFLSSDLEYKTIESAIFSMRAEKLLKLKAVWALEPKELQSNLLIHHPKYLHFAGHGFHSIEDTGKESSFLVAENGNRKTARISLKAMLGIVKNFSNELGLVTLNACNTFEMAREISKTCRYAIGVQGKITDGVSVSFSEGLYLGISTGHPIPIAFQMGCAQTEANNPGNFAVPTLFEFGVSKSQ